MNEINIHGVYVVVIFPDTKSEHNEPVWLCDGRKTMIRTGRAG